MLMSCLNNVGMLVVILIGDSTFFIRAFFLPKLGFIYILIQIRQVRKRTIFEAAL